MAGAKCCTVYILQLFLRCLPDWPPSQWRVNVIARPDNAIKSFQPNHSKSVYDRLSSAALYVNLRIALPTYVTIVDSAIKTMTRHIRCAAQSTKHGSTWVNTTYSNCTLVLTGQPSGCSSKSKVCTVDICVNLLEYKKRAWKQVNVHYTNYVHYVGHPLWLSHSAGFADLQQISFVNQLHRNVNIRSLHFCWNFQSSLLIFSLEKVISWLR